MTDDTQDQDELLRTLAAEYHRPPPTPREAIWARIQTARAADSGVAGAGDTEPVPPARVLPFRARRWGGGPAIRGLTWVTGVAALLGLGIGIGRVTGEPGGADPVAGVHATLERTAAERAEAVLAVAVTQFLSRSEAVLTSVRTGEDGAAFLPAARDLLTTTRLLIDSPAADDLVFRDLLEDLELVLAQVVLLPGEGPAGQERTFITAGMEHRNLMPRLRTAIPAGPTTGMYGEL